MKEELMIISRSIEHNGALSVNTTYFAGHITKEMLVGTEYEGEQIIYCTGWSNEPLTLVNTGSFRPAAIIHVQENEGK